MIKVENVSKKFELENEEVTAFENVSFEVAPGEFLAVIGPSGCGKSTLLRNLAGLQTPTSGKIEYSTPPKIGMVFQNFALFPYLTVFENIEFGLKMQGMEKNKRKALVYELIGEVGLSGYEQKHPKELSGGMKQRVGIARALAIEPNLFLLDEPFSSLDEFTAEVLRKLLVDIWEKRNITVILVTHLVRESIELADKILVMTKSPGKVKTIIENYLKRPRNSRSSEFFELEDRLINSIKV